jgi:hypothetical protein
VTKRTREIAERAAEQGITPLEFLVNTMRDTRQEFAARLDAAKAAAPYMHPRLAQVDQHNTGEQTVTVVVDTGVKRG